MLLSAFASRAILPHLPGALEGALLAALGGSFGFLGYAAYRRRRRTSGAHGTARWGRGRALTGGEGLLLGRRPRRVRRGKLLRYDGEGHLVTIAPTRSGKGTGVIIPNLLTYPGSVVVTDPKGENYAVTAARRQALGSAAVALDPFDLAGGAATLNPMDFVDPFGLDAIDDARLLADMLVVPEGRKDAASSFWNEEAKALLTGLILHVARAEPPAQRTLPRVRELLTLPPAPFGALLEEMLAAGGLVRRAAARLLQKAEKERSGVVSTAQTHTHFLDAPRMERVLGASSVDLGALKEGTLSLYLILPPERMDTYRGWLRLVIASAFLALAREPGRPERKVLFLLDEFANLGRMDPAVRAVSLAAGYGAQLWLFLQDLTQLKGIYPDVWGTFLANAGVLQTFGTADQETAELISKMTGQATVRAASDNENRGASYGAQLPGLQRGRGRGRSETARPLFLPDEVRRLPLEEELLFIQGSAPIRARKLDYRVGKEFAGRFDANPMYAPADRALQGG